MAEVESRLGQVCQDTQKAHDAAREAQAGSLKVSRMLKEREEAPGVVSDLGKRLKIYGAVEVEGSYERLDRACGVGHVHGR